MVRGKSSCHGEGGCVEQQQPCLLQVVKENWEEIGISLKIDKDIIRMMKDVKAKFDKARGKMSAAKKDELVTSLKETTLNIAASNWKQKKVEPGQHWTYSCPGREAAQFDCC